MGYSLSWLAVKGSQPEAVRAALSLRGTGTREAFPESEIAAAELPADWYLVVSNRDRLGLTKDETLTRLSTMGYVVACSVEEHVMFSWAAGWRDGRMIWSAFHESEKGIDHLKTAGDLPTAFPSIADRLRREQAAEVAEPPEVDLIFDIPVEVAKSQVGFRHDEDTPGLGPDAFEALTKEPAPAKAPLWNRLFGK